LKKSKPKREV
jgi:hypothetical protein